MSSTSGNNSITITDDQLNELVARLQRAEASASASVPTPVIGGDDDFVILPDTTEVSDAQRQILAELNAHQGKTSVSNTLVLRPGAVAKFPTTATNPIPVELPSGELFYETYTNGFIKTPGIGIFDAQVREQEYKVPLGDPNYGKKYLVLECQFALPGIIFGHTDEHGNHEIKPFKGLTRLQGRTVVAYTQVMGVTNKQALEAFRVLLAGANRFDPNTGKPVSSGWVQPNFGNSSPNVQGESSVSTSKSTVLWRLAPNTGATDPRAHLPQAIEQAMPVDSLSIRANRPREGVVGYTDPLTGIFAGLTQDILDSDENSPVRKAIVNKKLTEQVGVMSTSLTGFVHARQPNGGTDPLRGRFAGRADMPELTIGGQTFSFWNSTSGNVTGDTPA